jgi:hypothetical protein
MRMGPIPPEECRQLTFCQQAAIRAAGLTYWYPNNIV